MLKAFKYKLKPTPDQKDLLNQHFGCCRLVYNMSLAYKKSQYIEHGISISIYEIKKLLPIWKKLEENGELTFSFLNNVNSLSLQQSILNLDKGFQRFFKKQGGFPKFKSKKRGKQSFTVPQNTIVDFETGTVSIPKFKTGIKAVFHRQFQGDIKSSTISLLLSGKYEISILVDTKDEKGNVIEIPKPIEKDIITENQVVGIDLGLKEFLITSNGEKVDNPIFLRRSLRRLKRLQRIHARRNKKAVKVFEYTIDTDYHTNKENKVPILTKSGNHKYTLKLSKNSRKSQIRLTKYHYKVSCQRNDFLHKESRKLVNNNSFNCFAVEDLMIQNMQKNRKLSRAISDVSWYSFQTKLEYKTKWEGKHLIKVNTFFPSSKLCSKCNFKNTELKLKDRIWTCPDCLTKHDRDINAAINIKKQGFHLLTSSINEPRKTKKKIAISI
ncbi:MAG: RNA-guided endonuclease TnpB family protein [Patescibacteria group bacterium]